MAQTTTPATPGVPATMNTVWPPSNPSGTVIPFPLPWGQTGCCPPGGMDALMKCYCDIQQASAFIGQIMLDQINNNPAIIAAIIAGIEKSGSNLPLVGVTNGAAAQPGQVGEFVDFAQQFTYTTAQGQSNIVTMGVMQPGDWDMWAVVQYSGPVDSGECFLLPQGIGPVGGSGTLYSFIFTGTASDPAFTNVVSTTEQLLISVPTLISLQVNTNQVAASAAGGTCSVWFKARRRR